MTLTGSYKHRTILPERRSSLPNRGMTGRANDEMDDTTLLSPSAKRTSPKKSNPAIDPPAVFAPNLPLSTPTRKLNSCEKSVRIRCSPGSWVSASTPF